MAEVIRMPLLSDTMKEGVIAAWHKNVGDKVKADDVLADVETDKATMEVLPYVDGILLYLGVEKGKAAKVNDIIAIVGKEGEDYTQYLDPTNATQPVTMVQEQSISTATTTTTPADVTIPKGTTVVRMPLLSDTMKEGKIVAWLKQVGDKVKSDDVLAEVETDKATMEVMGYADGVLLYQGVSAGNAAKVNDIIAIVGKEGTDISALLAAENNNTQQTITHVKNTPNATEPPVVATAMASNAAANNNGRLKASPLAKKLAREKGFDLAQIKGSGDNGRIVKRDVEQLKQTNIPAANNVAMAAPAINLGEENYSDTPVSQMRSVIAKRLGESKFSAPHFYLTISVKMDVAMEARKRINELSPTKVSFNDLIVKACAMAMRKHPAVNSSWMGDSVRTYGHIHIGTAVAIEDGLIVPVIKFADQKSLSQIAEDSNSLIDKARNKKLQPQEFTGNTFTISNLGMMDIDEFTAIINPPDAAILAVGKIEATPVVEEGAIVVRHLMKLTMSCDHRVVDGAVGAKFLQTLKAHLENPVTMLI